MANEFLPDLASFLPDQTAAAPTVAPATPPNTGQGNWLTAALGSGYHNTLAGFGGFGQAAAKVVGADQLADQAAQFGASQRAQAATYARPDLEDGSLWNPTTLAYKATQGLPELAGILGGSVAGAGVAALAGPEAAAGVGLGAAALRSADLIGGAVGAFPGSVGSNVQRHTDFYGDLDQGAAAKALALGVPEAALNAILPAKLEQRLLGDVPGHAAETFLGSLKSGVKSGVLTQLPVGAATEWLTGQMGDPNRNFADRAQDMVDSALSGAVLGGVTAGVIHPLTGLLHALSKTPGALVTNADMAKSVDLAGQPPGDRPEPIPPLYNSMQGMGADFRGGPGEGVNANDPNAPIEQRNNPPPIAAPTPQAPLDLGQAGTLPAANDTTGGYLPPNLPNPMSGLYDNLPDMFARNENDPQSIGPAALQPGINTRVATGVPENDNQGARDNTGPASNVAPLQLPMPGAEPPANDLHGATRPAEPQAAINTRVAQGFPENRNEGFRVNDQPAGPQRDLPIAPARDVGAANNNNDDARPPTPQAPVPTNRSAGMGENDNRLAAPATEDAKPAPDIDLGAGPGKPNNDNQPFKWTSLKASLSKAAEGLPDELKGGKFDSLAEVQAHVADAVAKNGTDGKLGVVANRLGVIDDDGQLTGKFKQAEPVVAPDRVEQDAIPKTHQGRWQNLEDLRNVLLGDNLTGVSNDDPDRMRLLQKTADLQNELQKPGNRWRDIANETKDLSTQVDGLGARGAPAAEAAPEVKPRPIPEVAPDTPQASPEIAQKIKKAKAAKATPIAPEDIPAAKQHYANEQLGSLIEKQAASGQVTPVIPAVTSAIDRGKTNLTNLRNMGAIKDIADEDKFNQTDSRFQAALQEQQNRMDMYQRAASAGKEGLSLIPRDHFGINDLMDNFSNKVTPTTYKMLLDHMLNANELETYAKLQRGERPLIRYDSPPTPQDSAIGGLINQGKTGKDILDHMKVAGSTPEVKEMAAILSKSKADPAVNFAEGDQLRQDYAHELGPNETIPASYNDAQNRINVYDGSNTEQSMLHEMAHAASVRAIDSDSPAAKALTSIYDQVKERAPDRSDYGLTNKHEFVAETFGNQTFRDFLRSEPMVSEGKLTDMWNGFKNAVFKALGMTDRVRTLFDQVMDNANKLIAENDGPALDPRERMSIVTRGVNTVSRMGDMMTAQGMHQLYEEADGKRQNILTKSRGTMLSWVNSDHIGEIYKNLVPNIQRYVGLSAHKLVRSDLIAKPFTKAATMRAHLPEKAQDALSRSMARTAQNMDPRKSWAQNDWLHNLPTSTALEAEHADAVQDMNVLRGFKGGTQAYEAARAANSFGRYMKEVHHMQDHLAREHPELFAAAGDVFKKYEPLAKLQDDPLGSEAWARDEHTKLRGTMALVHSEGRTQIAKLQQSLKGALPPEIREEIRGKLRAAQGNDRAVSSLMSQMDSSDDQAKQGPYFHLGRTGDYFAAAYLAKDANGIPTDKATKGLSDALEKEGFGNVAVMPGMTNDHFYVRLEHPDELARMHKLLNTLDPSIIDQDKHVEQGQAHQASIYNSISPAYIRQAIEAMRSNPPDIPPGTPPDQVDALNQAHAQQQRELARTLMDMLPDTNMTKIYEKRMGVQGFQKDMFKSFNKSSMSQTRGLANISLARDIGAAAGAMKDDLTNLVRDRTKTTQQVLSASQAVGELSMRNQGFQAGTPGTPMDAIRKMTHLFSVGMSPAYFMTLMGQVGTLSWPELAKTHSFVGSAQALAKASPKTFAIMKAVAQGSEGATFGMRQEDLERANFSKADIDFMMNLAARGAFNQSARTEAMTGHDAGNHWLHMANSMGRYAEQMPRVLTALAARDLYMQRPVKGMSMEDFAHNAVMKSQMNWNPELNARQTTRAGNFGKMSPLINMFMGFQTRMTEKLYREWSDAFAGTRANESAEDAATRKQQSRAWVAAHSGAVVALAGTLGMPLVGVFANVYDKLSDLVRDRDDTDVIASYRNFLAGTFGKQAGEAIARGAPRLVGADFDHMGEDRIVPGSSAVMVATEKRKLEDMEKDWLRKMSGSAVGTGFNILAAARDLYNHDFLEAAIKLSPELIKSPMEAARLADRGFLDKSGNPLPIQANGGDVAMAALGIDPAKEAEYNEEKAVLTGLNTRRQMNSQNITQHLVKAQNLGDANSFQMWQQEAVKFSQEHPGMTGPLTDFGRALSMHMRSAAMARGFGTPIGLQPRDIAGRGMTAFGNLRNGDQ